ncbi:hypothetical protein OROMI_007205 [Orobanche minor]
MDNGNRKRVREDMENDQDETFIITVLLSFLVSIIGSWYHDKYFISGHVEGFKFKQPYVS